LAEGKKVQNSNVIVMPVTTASSSFQSKAIIGNLKQLVKRQ